MHSILGGGCHEGALGRLRQPCTNADRHRSEKHSDAGRFWLVHWGQFGSVQHLPNHFPRKKKVTLTLHEVKGYWRIQEAPNLCFLASASLLLAPASQCSGEPVQPWTPSNSDLLGLADRHTVCCEAPARAQGEHVASHTPHEFAATRGPTQAKTADSQSMGVRWRETSAANVWLGIVCTTRPTVFQMMCGSSHYAP